MGDRRYFEEEEERKRREEERRRQATPVSPWLPRGVLPFMPPAPTLGLGRPPTVPQRFEPELTLRPPRSPIPAEVFRPRSSVGLRYEPEPMFRPRTESPESRRQANVESAIAYWKKYRRLPPGAPQEAVDYAEQQLRGATPLPPTQISPLRGQPEVIAPEGRPDFGRMVSPGTTLMTPGEAEEVSLRAGLPKGRYLLPERVETALGRVPIPGTGLAFYPGKVVRAASYVDPATLFAEAAPGVSLTRGLVGPSRRTVGRYLRGAVEAAPEAGRAGAEMFGARAPRAITAGREMRKLSEKEMERLTYLQQVDLGQVEGGRLLKAPERRELEKLKIRRSAQLTDELEREQTQSAAGLRHLQTGANAKLNQGWTLRDLSDDELRALDSSPTGNLGQRTAIRAEISRRGGAGITPSGRPVETAGPLFERAAAPPREPLRPPTAGAAGVAPGPSSRPAIAELFGEVPTTPGLTRADRTMNLLKRTVGLGVEEEETATPIMRGRRQLQRISEVQGNRAVATIDAAIHEAFDFDDLTRIKNVPNSPTLSTLAARLPEYETNLSPKQREVMALLQRELEPYSRAIREEGIELGSRPDIMEGGFYIPRGRADKEGADAAIKVFVPSGKRGAKIAAERPIVFPTPEEGIAKGYRYAKPEEAIDSYVRTASNRIIDAHTANLFKTATDESGQLLGETSHARLLQQNGRIAEQISRLRAGVSSLLDSATRLDDKTHTAWAEFVNSPGPDLNALQESLSKLRITRGQFKGLSLEEAQSQLRDIRGQIKELQPEWQRALERARQIPREQGGIGFYQLQGTSFPDAMANAANRYLRAELPPSGRGTVITNVLEAFNNLLRGTRATADASFTGIQGLLGAVHDPGAYAKAQQIAVRSMADKRVLGRFLLDFDRQVAAEGLPTAREWVKAGLRLGGIDTEFMIGRGLGRLDVIQRVPGIVQANRAFGYFGDTLRLTHAQNAYRSATKGVLVVGSKDMRSIAEAANLMTGWSKGRFLGDVGNLVEFAPRFLQSQLELAVRAAIDWRSPTGQEARIMLLKLIGVGSLLTIAANEALGNKGLDYLTPIKNGQLNPNFMRIRIKGQDISLFGPWDSLLRGIVSGANGDFGYIARSKASPLIGEAWDVITGRTFMGEKVGVESFLRSLLPFSLSEIGQESAVTTAIGATGLKATPMTPSEQLAEAFRQETGRDYNWESKVDQAIVASNPRLAELEKARQEMGVKRGYSSAETAARLDKERLQTEKDYDLPNLAAAILKGDLKAGAQFSERWADYSREMAGVYRDAYFKREPRAAQTPVGKALDEYYNVRLQYDPVTHKPMWDQFFAARDKALADFPQEKAALEEALRAADPTVQRVEAMYREAKALRDQVPSKYRGTTPQEARDIDHFVFSEIPAFQSEARKMLGHEISQKVAAQGLTRRRNDENLYNWWEALHNAQRREQLISSDYLAYLKEHQDKLEMFFPYFYDSEAEQKALGIIVERPTLGARATPRPPPNKRLTPADMRQQRQDAADLQELEAILAGRR